MTLVDARGLRCPWPVIRAGRALREGALPLTILADDPNAETELASLATAKGLRLAKIENGHFELRPGP